MARSRVDVDEDRVAAAGYLTTPAVAAHHRATRRRRNRLRRPLARVDVLGVAPGHLDNPGLDGDGFALALMGAGAAERPDGQAGLRAS